MPRRLSLLWRGLFSRRSAPDIDALAAITDPEEFVWAVLPHAARTFAASIVVLPRDEALAAAVAYLYARMLDTFEDLGDDPVAQLTAFAARFDGDMPVPDPASLRPDDVRDRVHVLLVSRASLVDEVFTALPEARQQPIAELIGEMAKGMAWASERFREQGGVLVNDEQLLRYCQIVIGYPVLFAVDLVTGRPAPSHEDAMAASELIQLANITRDIEKDLVRSVAYDPSLGDYLGSVDPDAVRAVRRRLTLLALQRGPAYRRLYEGVELSSRGRERLAATLMLAFTDLHYRSLVRRVGEKAWRGPRGKLGTVGVSLPALLSARYASGLVARITLRFADAAGRLSR